MNPSPTPPERLYKYVTFDRLDVLRNECIRFTQPADLNDPFELKPHLEKLMTNEDEEKWTINAFVASWLGTPFEDIVQKRWDELTEEDRSGFSGGYSRFRDECANIVVSNPEFPKEALDNLTTLLKGVGSEETQASMEGFAAQVGILSLTSKRDNDLMWPHYTDSHKGMVLEFDTSHDFFTSYGGRVPFQCRSVIYSPVRPSFANMNRLAQAAQDQAKFGEIFFLTKSQSWSYEEEWRMARLVAEADKKIDADPPVYLFKLPAKCINGVILGAKMPDVNRHTVIDFIRTDPRYGHVALSQAKISTRTFELEIEPLTS